MNIFLIGYRGTGKSTISKLLSKKLQKGFLDTDDLIVSIREKSIPEIFEKEGEKRFRKCETAALKKAVRENPSAVIATGGGLVLKPQNQRILRRNGICIYLFASEDEIYSRIFGDENRPALTNKSPRQEIHDVLAARKPIYESLADFSLDTGNQEAEKSAELILDALSKRGDLK